MTLLINPSFTCHLVNHWLVGPEHGVTIPPQQKNEASTVYNCSHRFPYSTATECALTQLHRKRSISTPKLQAHTPSSGTTRCLPQHVPLCCWSHFATIEFLEHERSRMMWKALLLREVLLLCYTASGFQIRRPIASSVTCLVNNYRTHRLWICRLPPKFQSRPRLPRKP